MKQKKFFLLGIFFLVLTFATIFLHSIYTSWQSEILKLQMETKKLQAEEKILSNFSARYDDLEDFLNLNEENFLTVREFLPAEPDQENFTNEIYRAADKNNISVNSLQTFEPLTLEVDKNFSEKFFRQSIKVQFESSYIDLLNFLREISDGKRFVTVANISVEVDDEILNCEVEFFIYFTKISE